MIKLAIIGTGGMARAHATAYKAIPRCKVVAGVDLDGNRVRDFCKTHSIPHAFTSVEEMLAERDIDAASVVTPDVAHVGPSLVMIRAGKHVLCEKPLAPTAKEAKKLVDAIRRRKNLIHMVNFSYRTSSALHAVHKLVAAGRIGRIMHLEAHYLQTWLSSTIWGDWRKSPSLLWRLSTDRGSKGVLGDIGVHIVDLASYAAAEDIVSVNGRLKTFSKAPRNRIGQYTLDANDSATMQIELKNGGIGTITATRWATGQVNSLRLLLYGDKGGVRLDLDRSYDEYEICVGKANVNKARWKIIKAPKTPTMYERFIKGITSGKNDSSDFIRGWNVQKVLDACSASNDVGRAVRIT